MIEITPKDGLSVTKIQRRVTPTKDVALGLAKAQRARILKRTAKGEAFDGKAFAPYSKNGPYYYYPAGRVKGRSQASQRGSAVRAFRNITGKSAREHTGRRNALSGPMGEAWVTPGGGLGFSSYDSFKKWAGRSSVDLLGLREPHMLDAMQATATAKGNEAEGVIGIYGAKAKIALGHHKGNRKTKLPRRRFLDASKADERAMKQEFEVWLRGRLR